LLKENQIKLQKKLIQQKNTNITWLIAVLSLVLILALALLWVYRSLRITKNRLEISIIEKDALLREIHHRVKNNLQIVSSLLNMHVRKVKDPSSKKILEEGSERLLAMSLIHKNLYPHADLKSVSLDEYLENLSYQLLENYQLNQNHITLETHLEKISVDIDKLIPIGLVVNELLSNAMKHAFEEDATGKIYIRLFQQVPESIILEVADNGKGIPEDWQANRGNSLGMKLVKIFCDKLKTELIILNDAGTKVQLNIPLL
jgi:two-component sensor histidine kinase